MFSGVPHGKNSGSIHFWISLSDLLHQGQFSGETQNRAQIGDFQASNPRRSWGEDSAEVMSRHANVQAHRKTLTGCLRTPKFSCLWHGPTPQFAFVHAYGKLILASYSVSLLLTEFSFDSPRIPECQLFVIHKQCVTASSNRLWCDPLIR